jgi:hypothetical protein
VSVPSKRPTLFVRNIQIPYANFSNYFHLFLKAKLCNTSSNTTEAYGPYVCFVNTFSLFLGRCGLDNVSGTLCHNNSYIKLLHPSVTVCSADLFKQNLNEGLNLRNFVNVKRISLCLFISIYSLLKAKVCRMRLLNLVE